MTVKSPKHISFNGERCCVEVRKIYEEFKYVSKASSFSKKWNSFLVNIGLEFNTRTVVSKHFEHPTLSSSLCSYGFKKEFALLQNSAISGRWFWGNLKGKDLENYIKIGHLKDLTGVENFVKNKEYSHKHVANWITTKTKDYEGDTRIELLLKADPTLLSNPIVLQALIDYSILEDLKASTLEKIFCNISGDNNIIDTGLSKVWLLRMLEQPLKP